MSQNQQTFTFSLETGEIIGEINDQSGNDSKVEQEVKVLTVSGLNLMIKNSLEGQFPLLWLRGELSNFKPHTSGHLYFSLKDSSSQVSAVMFRGYTKQLNFNPKDGLEVLIRGRVSVYEPRGSYQIYVESMEPMGAGALQKAFEDLKLKLQKEGLFSLDHKKQLPFLPKKIALITSPTGAAVRDMIQVLGRRFKAAEITILPVLTQGQGSAESLTKAVKIMDQMNFDVAIIGRGGGSIEDLWSFNDETLARTIYACNTPIVSAVGHEIDFTICDFVSDVRAPTPSAAAELVTKNVDVIKENLSKYQNKLKQLLLFKVKNLGSQVLMFRRSLVDPKKRLSDLRLKCDDWMERLIQQQKQVILNHRRQFNNSSAMLIRNKNFPMIQSQKLSKLSDRLKPSFLNQFQNKKNKFSALVGMLDSLSPLSVMHRGFSIVRKNNSTGEILAESNQLKQNDKIWIQMSSGSLEADVTKVNSSK